MNIILIFVVSFALILTFMYFFLRFKSRFTVIRINEFSMWPTLKPGQIRVMDRHFKRFLINNIYVYLSPITLNDDEYYVINRLKKFRNTEDGLYFEGDNLIDSHDSRHYGYVNQSAVLGELVTWRFVLNLVCSGGKI